MKRDPVVIGCCGANLASLGFALERLGVDAPVTADPERVAAATHVLLPGVGAARSAMERLEAAGLADVVPRLTQPVLGICLGMQLLFASSEEEDVECLGVMPGRVARLPQNAELPVPHMGWNQLELARDTALLRDVPNGAYAYFVHSYAVPVGAYTRATSRYGIEFSAVVEQGNFFGTQFHPERSSQVGASILANFLAL
ncbi:MAG TPA: imidazole glycerol phosphate synthase subunit HisH [Gammaproteobacteria bacterium]|nr:imidazole glycerol phosphate synthase subunit HisH [Gammaproteobacteria bacterium]